jgi:hypothetical protein
MRFRICILALVLGALPAGVLAQCSNSNLKAVWDTGRSQFRCTDTSHPGDNAKDESVQPVGDKEFCTSARENLQAACPQGNDGKACRSQAKSIYNACYKKAKSESESQSSGLGNSNPASRTDASSCMTIFQQRQQACNSRRMPPPSPGQMTPPDTCMQDAMAAQRECLANSH